MKGNNKCLFKIFILCLIFLIMPTLESEEISINMIRDRNRQEFEENMIHILKDKSIIIDYREIRKDELIDVLKKYESSMSYLNKNKKYSILQPAIFISCIAITASIANNTEDKKDFLVYSGMTFLCGYTAIMLVINMKWRNIVKSIASYNYQLAKELDIEIFNKGN